MIYLRGFNLLFITMLLIVGSLQSQPLTSGENDPKANEIRQVKILHQLVEKNMTHNTPLALDYATQALTVSQQGGYTYGAARSYYFLGQIYGCEFEDFEKGIEYHKQSISAAQQIDSVEMLARNYFSLGRLYYGLGLYATSLHHFNTSLNLYRKKQDVIHESIVQIHVASIYSEWGGTPYDTAVSYYTHALLEAEEHKNEYLLVYTLYLYTTSLIEHNHFDEAEKYVKEALSITENNESYHYFTHRFYSNMGEILLHRQDIPKAIAFFEKSRTASRNHKIRYGEAFALLKLGNAHYASHEFPKAENYYQEALRAYKGLNMRKKIIETYGALAALAGTLNNFKRAFHYRSTQLVYEDSVCEDQKNNLILEMSTRAAEISSEKQTLIEKKNAHINELYITLLVSIITTLIFLGLLYLNHQRLRTAKERSMLVNEKLLLQKELETKKLEEEQLKQKLEFHAKTLTTNTLNLIQKNEILEKIKLKAEEIRKSSAIDLPAKLNNLMHTVNFALNLDKDWENFKIHFEQVHNNFFDHLKSKFPDLNSNDLKLCALLKLNLDTKQIATVMDISPESVKVARSRLRKKLQLEQSENLSSFITHV
jgi:tetratricopeptide (TPR) repeat protein